MARAKRKIKWQAPVDEQGRPIVDAYLRMSDTFKGKEDNRENQLEDINPLYEDNDWALGEVLQDEVSAWQRGVVRDDYEQLLERIRTGLSAGVAFYDQDRLLRRPMDLERLLELWEEGRDGMVIASMYGPVNLQDGNARLNMRNAAANAMKQSDDTSRRARRKNVGKRSRGILVKGGPRAFAWPGLEPASGELDEGGQPIRRHVSEERLEAERDALQWAFEFVAGGGALAKVAAKWNEQELFSFYGNSWTTITVRQTMSKPRYAGRIAHDGEVVGQIANHEPTIDPDLFDQVQARFAGRRRGRPVTGRYLASGVVLCGRCGAKLMSRPQWRGSGKAVPAYRCHKCALSILQAPLDSWLREFTIMRLSDPEAAKRISAVQLGRNDEIVKLSAELATIREDEDLLVEKLARGDVVNREAWQRSQQILVQRATEKRARLNALRAASANVATVQVESRQEVEHEWDTSQAEGDIERLRQMLKEALHDFGEVRIQPTTSRGGRTRPPEERIDLIPFG